MTARTKILSRKLLIEDKHLRAIGGKDVTNMNNIFQRGDTVVQWLALSPHSKRIPGPLLCGVCMYFLSLREFSPGTPVSTPSPKNKHGLRLRPNTADMGSSTPCDR